MIIILSFCHLIDIDECEDESDLCSQNCRNTEESYDCYCNEGYIIGEDNTTCNGNICFFIQLHILSYLIRCKKLVSQCITIISYRRYIFFNFINFNLYKIIWFESYNLQFETNQRSNTFLPRLVICR
jgi:hypothetical protein